MGIDYEDFGPYAVYECLGTGGMATVHRAIYDDGKFVREVALKRLLPQHADDKTFVDDFVREGKLAARLSHPSIVKIYELGHHDHTHFIAMELVLGVPLMALIRAAHQTKRATPIGVVLTLMSELCDALDYACNGTDRETGERFNFVHRDLSPSNLLVTEDGHIKVIDFGVAKATAGKRFTTSTGLVKGKLGYMSVEALAGKAVDGRSDVFSVGVVAWELITGKRLFVGKTELEVIQRVRDGGVVPPSTFNPACTPTLDSIVLQALARGRDDRWASAGALRQALETTRRAYREEATPECVVAWREGLLPTARPGEAQTVPTPKFERPDSDSEKTQYRETPARPPTELDLLDDDAVAIALGSQPFQPFDDGAGLTVPATAPPPVAELQLFDAFPADEGSRTVQASPAYPASAFREVPTKAYVDPVDSYAELSVSRSEGTSASLTLTPSPTVTAPTPLPPVEPPSGTSITALTLAPPPQPQSTLEMLQLDDAGGDLLDLEEPSELSLRDLPELLDLDEPAAPPLPPDPDVLDLPPTHLEASPTHLELSNDTIVVKRNS